MPTRPNKLALVTGGNRGLGRAAVLALGATGVDVVFTYRSHEGEAREVTEAVTAAGRTVEAIQLDTARPATFASFTDSLRQTLRKRWERDSVDILINNAGVSGDTVLGATDEDTIDQLFAVTFKGVYLLTQALATAAGDTPPLLADGGRILNVSTGLARFVTAPYSVYASMKGAIEVLTRYWAVELGQRRITVNAIAPGPVATDFAGGLVRDNDDVQRAMSATTALGRIAHAEDIGPAVAALVADANGWITGQCIEASGGFRL